MREHGHKMVLHDPIFAALDFRHHPAVSRRASNLSAAKNPAVSSPAPSDRKLKDSGRERKSTACLLVGPVDQAQRRPFESQPVADFQATPCERERVKSLEYFGSRGVDPPLFIRA